MNDTVHIIFVLINFIGIHNYFDLFSPYSFGSFLLISSFQINNIKKHMKLKIYNLFIRFIKNICMK